MSTEGGSPGRRRVIAAAGVFALLAGLGTTASLESSGALDLLPSPGVPRLWSAPDWYAAADLARGRDSEQTEAWVDAGRVPGAGTAYEEMVRAALRDLRRLVNDDGGVSAGAGANWHYNWPRDTAFVALALARTGHRDEAMAALSFLSARQDPSGGFEARYLLDRLGVPDDRTAQSDAPGWLLWSLGQVAVTTPEPTTRSPRRPEGPDEGFTLPDDVRRLADRSLDNLLRITRDGTVLPEPTPDYWEVPQDSVSLGQVAPMVAGLRGAGSLYQVLGDGARVARAGAAERRLTEVVVAAFGPTFQRHGDSGGRDASTSMFLPPFVPERAAVIRAWQGYQRGALRPAGGLSPGTSWFKHEESWTPETALVAYTAASSGRPQLARHWLDWLDSVRTPWGALPEKVMPDGRPAGPAPLAWTAALVILTVDELERTGG